MLKKYYTEYDEIKAFVESFHRQANKLLTAHTRKKLTKLMIQLTDTPYVSTQHELICCSSPGLTADIQIEGMDSEGVIHVSLTNRRAREGERHVIHYDCYRVPFRYVRPHSYHYIAQTLAASLFPDGLPEDRVEAWETQIADILLQLVGLTDPVSRGEYVEDKYLAFDYHFPLLKVTSAINDSIVVKEFCLDNISHSVGTRATLESYLALQDVLSHMDALCQQHHDTHPAQPGELRPVTKASPRHLTRQAHRLIDLLRVLRRLTHLSEATLRDYLTGLLETPTVTAEGIRLDVIPETVPTLRLTTQDSEWLIALSVAVIIELTEPAQGVDEHQIAVTTEPVRTQPHALLPGRQVDLDASSDFSSVQHQPLNQLVQKTLTHTNVFLDKNGDVDTAKLYYVLDTSLDETGPVLGWFRQKGVYVKYRVKKRSHPVLSTLLIKVDIIKELPTKRNLVNIDIEVSRDDMDELSYVWKLLWMSLVMQADRT